MALEQSGVGGPELKTINTQLKLLEAHLPSDPFIIGGTFNLKADVTLFVEEEIGDLSFSLFHDVVMLMESITDGQIKKSEVMASLYQAQHVGFDEDEATHIHFFKLIVPYGMDDVSLAVSESIGTACAIHPAAAKLASEMIYQTQVFINDLCGWVDSFLMELIKTSQVPSNDPWKLVASCLRKLFEVI